MGTPQQLHDRSVAGSQVPIPSALSPETAQMLGHLTATVGNNTKTVSELAESVKSLTSTISDQRVEMQRYWSGLEKANADIMVVREAISDVIEKSDKLETHVKSLNGVDAKLRLLGIDIHDQKRVDAVRRFIDDGIESSRTRNDIKTRVMQGVALAVAMALGAAAWNGIVAGVVTPTQQQEMK